MPARSPPFGQWAAAHADSMHIDTLVAGAADGSTFRRVFARVDADALAAAIGAWLWTRTATQEGRRVIAIDGKTVRVPGAGLPAG